MEEFDLNLAPERLDRELLIRLPDKDFKALCSSSKKFYSYCNRVPISESIYHERCLYWFDNDLLQFKEVNMTWKEFYNRLQSFLINEKSYVWYIFHDNLMELKLSYKINPFPITYNDIYFASYHNSFSVLKWLISLNPDIVLDQLISHVAARNGNLDIVKFLADLSILPDQIGVDLANAYGYKEIVEFLATKGVYPN
jgi:hypothetical protein